MTLGMGVALWCSLTWSQARPGHLSLASGAVIGSADGAGGLLSSPPQPSSTPMLLSGLFWGGCSGVPSGPVKSPSSLEAIEVPLATPLCQAPVILVLVISTPGGRV